MIQMQTFRLGPPPASRGLGAFLTWTVGLIVAGTVLVLGAIFAVFTALAVAALAVFAGVALWAVRLTRGRRPAPVQAATSGDPEIIDARKVGDQWVAYGFDGQAR